MTRITHSKNRYCTKNVPQGVNCPPVSTNLFVIGDFMVIDPQSKPRFDEKMSLKEDYDFTAAHLKEYGVVARSNRVFCLAKHYVNSGGAVADRTGAREQYHIAVRSVLLFYFAFHCVSFTHSLTRSDSFNQPSSKHRY